MIKKTDTVDIVVRRGFDFKRASWEMSDEHEPRTPCRIKVYLIVGERQLRGPYWVDCRTRQALQYARLALVRTLQALDGAVMIQKPRLPKP